MRQVKTISVSLEPEYVRQLEALAKKAGSKSDAVRLLLRQERDRELDEIYREAYSDPEFVKESLELGRAMLSVASFPEDWYVSGKRPSRRKRPSR